MQVLRGRSFRRIGAIPVGLPDPGYFAPAASPSSLIKARTLQSSGPSIPGLGDILIPTLPGIGPLLGGGGGGPSVPQLPIAQTPGPVAFRPGNWDLSRTPAEYVIAQGDTMVGIAALYLGRGDRWGEIRDMQINPDGQLGPNGPYLNHYDSVWFPGDPAPGSEFREGAVLLMPPEAADKARQLGADPTTPKAPTTPGAPGTKPPGPGTPTPPGSGMSKTGKALAFGFGGLLLGGAVLAAKGML